MDRFNSLLSLSHLSNCYALQTNQESNYILDILLWFHKFWQFFWLSSRLCNYFIECRWKFPKVFDLSLCTDKTDFIFIPYQFIISWFSVLIFVRFPSISLLLLIKTPTLYNLQCLLLMRILRTKEIILQYYTMSQQAFLLILIVLEMDRFEWITLVAFYDAIRAGTGAWITEITIFHQIFPKLRISDISTHRNR
jgi:hypothetical protein